MKITMKTTDVHISNLGNTQGSKSYLKYISVYDINGYPYLFEMTTFKLSIHIIQFNLKRSKKHFIKQCS